MSKDNNEWDEYKKLILYSLDNLKLEIATLKSQHESLRNQLITLSEDYKYSMGKIKVYLTIGVALAGGVVELVFLGVNHFAGAL